MGVTIDVDMHIINLTVSDFPFPSPFLYSFISSFPHSLLHISNLT